MPTCSKCGTENGVTNFACLGCGAALESGAIEYYILQATTNQVLGPIRETDVKDWISQNRLTSRDSLAVTGNSTWVPILQSQFKEYLVDQMNVERLAASTCPRCGAGMVALAKRSQAGLWLIIVGVILTPVCIGTALWIWGMILMHGTRGQTYLQCPRCKYTAG